MKICLAAGAVWGGRECRGQGQKVSRTVMEDLKPPAEDLGFRFGSARHPR